MKRELFFVIFCGLCMFLAGCGKKPKVDTTSLQIASQSAIQADSTSTHNQTLIKQVAVEAGKKKSINVYVSRKAGDFEGGYHLKKDAVTTSLYIHQIKGDTLWFSYRKVNCFVPLAKAVRASSDTFTFTIACVDEDFGEYGMAKRGKLKGRIQLLQDKIYFDLDGDEKKSSDPGYQGTLKKEQESKNIEVCDLSKCLGDYFSVRDSLYSKSRKYVDLGKKIDSNQVSYVDVRKENYSALCDEDEIKYYQIGNINFFSTKKECDKEFGEPIRKTKTERVYQYKDKYELVLTFDSNQLMRGMGIYFQNKETAMKKYKIGDFEMRGCKVVKYCDGYRENQENVVLPEGTVGICVDAFSVIKEYTEDGYDLIKEESEFSKIALNLPKEVYIEPFAFREMGPAKITFEEGREEIERRAFAYAADASFDIQVILPKSIRRIRKEAFLGSGVGGLMDVTLNEGLEVVDEFALSGLSCKLPSTIRKLGAHALENWNPQKDYRLPESLEEIGDFCILVEEPQEKFVIPQGVKKIGVNPIRYGDNPYKGGVKVDSKNPYFKSDNKGWLFSKDGKTLYMAFSYEGDLVVSDSVKYIKCELVRDPNGEGGKQEIKLPKNLKEDEYSKYLENPMNEN